MIALIFSVQASFPYVAIFHRQHAQDPAYYLVAQSSLTILCINQLDRKMILLLWRFALYSILT